MEDNNGQRNIEEKKEMVFPSGGSSQPEGQEEIVVEEVIPRIEPPKITIFGKSFWDLWLMKLFRNIASVKYQWMILLYIPVIYGMFHVPEGKTDPVISATAGLTFLGGGFITLATSRIISRTKLTEEPNGDLDTDR